MLAKLALLLQSKVAAAVIGILVVGGTGTAVAVAANGGRLPFTQPAATGNTTTGHQTGQAGDHGQQVSLEGTLKSYDAGAATISVLGENQTTVTTFTVSGGTLVNGEHASALADLAQAVGRKVQVQAEKQSDGTLLATKVTVEAADGSQGVGQQGGQPQHAAIAGTIASIGSGSFVVKTWDGKQVTVTVGAQTTFDGAAHSFGELKAGELVAAEGTLQPDGALAATKVTAGPVGGSSGSGTGQQQGGVSGVIASIGSSSFVLTTPDGKHVTVQVTAATTYWGQAHSFGDLKVGEQVAAQGSLLSDGSLAASAIAVHVGASN